MSNAHEVWSTQSVIAWSYKRDDGEKTRIKLIHLMQNHEILDPALNDGVRRQFLGLNLIIV